MKIDQALLTTFQEFQREGQPSAILAHALLVEFLSIHLGRTPTADEEFEFADAYLDRVKGL